MAESPGEEQQNQEPLTLPARLPRCSRQHSYPSPAHGAVTGRDSMPSPGTSHRMPGREQQEAEARIAHVGTSSSHIEGGGVSWVKVLRC